MDQKIIRGIGNAYADEILWEARIHPESAGNKIPDGKIRDLVKAIKSVFKNAIDKILVAEPEIISGEFRDFLNIHHPRKKKSPGGALIQTMQLSSRKTYFTNEQVLYE